MLKNIGHNVKKYMTQYLYMIGGELMINRIEPNSRQVPSVLSICSNKKYYDILYSYLQCISSFDEKGSQEERYLSKKEINFSKIGSIFGVSRQTISTKFKNLIELGLVEEKDGLYILKVLPNDYAYLIPNQTLSLLTDTLSENSVSTYIYLFNRYLGCKEKPFTFSLDQIKTWIGTSTKTRSNDSVITNILFVLKKIGLIDYHLVTQFDEDNPTSVKTVYQIDWVRNKVIQ